MKDTLHFSIHPSLTHFCCKLKVKSYKNDTQAIETPPEHLSAVFLLHEVKIEEMEESSSKTVKQQISLKKMFLDFEAHIYSAVAKSFHDSCQKSC